MATKSTKRKRTKQSTFWGLWSQAKKQFKAAHMPDDEIETERQELLRLAGAKPDKNGRFSMTKLTNPQFNTACDLIETTILGRPNKRRRSKSLIYAIEQLHLDEPLLNKVSNDTYSKPWRELSEAQLTNFRYTATRIARRQNSKS